MTQNDWIKVEDRLPEDEIDVLATDGLDVSIAYYALDIEEFIERGKPLMFRVKYWQPLPQPPQP